MGVGIATAIVPQDSRLSRLALTLANHRSAI